MYLIGQVGREVVGAGVIEVAGQSHISMAKEDHVRCSAGDKKVRAHIKLFPLQEQRPLDVTGGEMSVCVQDNFNSSVNVSMENFICNVVKYRRQLPTQNCLNIY